MSVGAARTNRIAAMALVGVGIALVLAMPIPPFIQAAAEDEGSDGYAFQDVGSPPKLSPGDLSALFARAMLSWRDGEIGRALREFDEVVRLKRRLLEIAVEEF